MRPLACLAVVILLVFSAQAQLPKKIVMIGGKETVAARTILPALGAHMRATPAFAGCEVWLYPTGWPEDPKALDGTAAILLYLNSVQEIPGDALRAAERMQEEGTGIVAIREIFPGARPFAAMNANMVRESSPTLGHPLTRGIEAFGYKGAARALSLPSDLLVPILRDANTQCIAWAGEAQRAGRYFQFTGGAKAEELEIPQVRKLLLNALAWTAGLEVPATGVDATEPIVGAAIVTKPEENEVIPQEWGKLSWYTSAKLKNTRTLTSGMAVLKPGQTNPRHFHPNCDEVLHVLAGKIRHSMNDKTVEMSAGDTVSIPSGVVHNAANIGTEDAVLAISFSSAYRVVIGEK